MRGGAGIREQPKMEAISLDLNIFWKINIFTALYDWFSLDDLDTLNKKKLFLHVLLSGA